LIAEVSSVYVGFYERFMERVHGLRITYIQDGSWGTNPWDDPCNQSVWPRIATFISSLQLPHFEFIRHKFLCSRRTPPSPLVLLSDAGADELSASLELATQEAAEQLKQQLVANEVICREGPGDWLGDGPNHDLARRPDDRRSCLLLYSLAVRRVDEPWAEFHRTDALRQYLTNPYAYRVAWKDVLPPDIHYDALTFFGADLPPVFFRPSGFGAAGRSVNGRWK